MKRFNFLPAVVALVLVVAAVGCTTIGGTSDEYYDRGPATNRVYVDDPYRGTVVLERDPYTGRYYEIGSFGGFDSRYDRRYDSRYYDNRYYGNNMYGRTPYDRNYNRGTYRGSRGQVQHTTPPQRPTDEQVKEREKNREEARRKILGN